MLILVLIKCHFVKFADLRFKSFGKVVFSRATGGGGVYFSVFLSLFFFLPLCCEKCNNDFCREREEKKEEEKNQAKTELSIKNIFSPQNLLIYLMK